MHTHVAWLSFSRLISIMFCELPLTYFHRLPERKLLSGGVAESTARRHLKSPRSLSGRSLHLVLVTKRSWMPPFCSKSIGLPIAEIQVFQNLTLKIQSEGHGQVQSQWLHLMHIIQSIYLLRSLWQSDYFGLDMANFIFDLENLRSMSWPRSNPIATFRA